MTNSLPVATELVGRGPRLIVIGGELRATSRALVGPLTRLVVGMYDYYAGLDVARSTTDAWRWPCPALTRA